MDERTVLFWRLGLSEVESLSCTRDTRSDEHARSPMMVGFMICISWAVFLPLFIWMWLYNRYGDFTHALCANGWNGPNESKESVDR